MTPRRLPLTRRARERRRRERQLRWLERGLLGIGLVCLGWFGFVQVDAAYYRHQQEAALERVFAAGGGDQERRTLAEDIAAALTTLPAEPIKRRNATAAPLAKPVTPALVTAGAAAAAPRLALMKDRSAAVASEAASLGAIGLLRIPRLRVSTPVLAGDDDLTLRRGIGHLPDTPRPWEPGNSAIAGHRDSHFRPLKRIRVGDELTMLTPEGELRYRVTETLIVLPEDVSVLQQTEKPTLTLITCYPFNYIGTAPKRFVVRAERLD